MQQAPDKNDFSWLASDEGQLSVDVLEDAQNIYVRSAIAGTRAEDLDISVTQDTLTIRGKRAHGCREIEEATMHVEECYWGDYSRTIVLPSHVAPEATDASLKNGILTITLKKAEMAADVDVVELE